MKQCKITSCSTAVKHNTVCKKHWAQINKHGKPVRTKYDPRPAVIEGDTAKIPLGLNGYNGYAIVDKKFAYLDKYKWNKSDFGYARALINGSWKKLHRVISDAPSNRQVDHINGNRLDNRHKNLRIVTNAENARNRGKQTNNTTGYKGVYRRGQRYVAKIVKYGRQIHLGTYDTALEAAKAYDSGAIEVFGKFAKLNIKEKGV